jgi:hypothetical protein
MLANKTEHEETFSIILSGDFPKEADFILSQDYDKLVEGYVSTMGKDATEVSITTLCRLFNFPCKIYSQGYLKPLDTIPSQAKSPRAILFRTNEHYFLAYTEAAKMHTDVKEKEKKMKSSPTSFETGRSLPKMKQEKVPARKDPFSFEGFGTIPSSLGTGPSLPKMKQEKVPARKDPFSFESFGTIPSSLGTGSSLPKMNQEKVLVRKDSFDDLEDLPLSLGAGEDNLEDEECLRLADQFVNELTTEDLSEYDEPLPTFDHIPYTTTTSTSQSSSSSTSSTSSTSSSSKKQTKRTNIIEAYEF